MTRASDARRRQEENIRIGRELARRLAGEAETIAGTFEQLAEMHEALAAVSSPPLSQEARDRAVTERRLAGRERAASAWFLSICEGTCTRPDSDARRPAPRS